MENDEKLQKIQTNASEDVQTRSELKEESESVAAESTQISDQTPESEAAVVSAEEPSPSSQKEEENISSEAPNDEQVAQTPTPETESEAEPEVDADEKELDGIETAEEEVFDFDEADKKALLKNLKEAKNEENIKRLDKLLKALKPRFDELYDFDKNKALQKFVSEGNDPEAFEYHGEEEDKDFSTLYNQLKAKRNKHYRELNDQRDENLKKKNRLLEALRNCIEGEESEGSISSVKEIQAEWKKIGPVPGAQNQNLWANYNALLDRYYDNRSIYFELKDLDRKKNSALKQELCEKAEALLQKGDLKSAIVELNDLHEEYKHIGPVPKEEQEPLWQRFKAASDAIYAQRKEYFDHLKEEFEANLVKKEALIVALEERVQFDSDRITEWNQQTKAIQDIQKQWEEIGGVPKDKAKEINRRFWNTFKKFFASKSQFFKKLEGQKEANLEKKKALILQAEELKVSEEWDKTAEQFKKLQAEWKDIGPVPDKVRNSIYASFKEACDHFFNRRRDQNKEKFKVYDENLKLKEDICKEIETQAEATTVDLDKVYGLIDDYTSTGFVPKKAINKIAKRFDESVSKLMSNNSLEDRDRMDLKNHMEVGRLRSVPGGNRMIQRKEHTIRRKISNLESDISTWNTNMEFFANSATADKLKEEMQQKVSEAEKELSSLKDQLRALQ